MLLFVLGLSCPAVAQITRSPYLQNATQTSMTIMWGTDFYSTGPGTLYYGSEPGVYPNSVVTTNTFGLHIVTLDGLSPNQTLYYYVQAEGETIGQNDANYFLTTAPVSDASFRFAAYGDSRSEPANHAKAVDMIRDNSPDMIIHVGDYVGTGTIENYEDQFFTPAAPLLRNTPLFPSRGNHDTDIWYPHLFITPDNNPAGSDLYYSFDYGLAHFICLDTVLLLDGVSADQDAWLQADLAANTKPWTFVFFHHPAYSSGSHGDTGLVQTTWMPLLEQYDVTIVFAGHDHIYDAYLKDDVYHIVTGGGGAPLGTGGPHPPYQIIDFYNIRYHCCIIEVSAEQLEYRGVDKHGVFHTIVIPRQCRLSVEEKNGAWGDVDLDPVPGDPNLPKYPYGTPVTLTATPIDGKVFGQWELYDPNHPGDANYAAIDANSSIAIVMDADREVTAVFKCGGAGQALPLLMVGVALCALAARRGRWRPDR